MHFLSAFSNTLRTIHPAAKTIVFIALALGQAVASADEYTDVSKLLKNNQMAEALSKADQFLSSKPRDPQMRFLKGVIQSETGRANDAINTFNKLTEEYPELPEPYNNLAVLYANTNQFDKARGALEMAIRTNPSYSTAHENLGDIYAKLASQAYSKALQLDVGNKEVPPKLALIRDLFTATSTNRSAPLTTPVNPPPSPVVAPIAAKPPAVITAGPTNSSQPSIAPPVVAQAILGRDVEASVQAWAKAWADRDMKTYLGSYGKDFVPSGKLSRSAWEEERKSRIMGKAHITVRLSELTVSVSGNTAVVKFKQDYKADALTAASRKTLEMVKAGDRWLINKEISG